MTFRHRKSRKDSRSPFRAPWCQGPGPRPASFLHFLPRRLWHEVGVLRSQGEGNSGERGGPPLWAQVGMCLAGALSPSRVHA